MFILSSSLLAGGMLGFIDMTVPSQRSTNIIVFGFLLFLSYKAYPMTIVLSKYENGLVWLMMHPEGVSLYIGANHGV